MNEAEALACMLKRTLAAYELLISQCNVEASFLGASCIFEMNETPGEAKTLLKNLGYL